jgi:hypothetical protein
MKRWINRNKNNGKINKSNKKRANFGKIRQKRQEYLKKVKLYWYKKNF